MTRGPDRRGSESTVQDPASRRSHCHTGQPGCSDARLDLPRPRESARILVIDDYSGVVDILATALSEEGYGISSAATCDEGLQLFIASCPDLVLLDIALPGMNGIEVLKRIRSISPTARVVMVSGDSARSREALDLGALACVNKPFDLADLKRVVAAALQDNPF